ncbi:flagellar export chaperone FlgN [Janthinobacterium fluminis]|uniref:Flagellar export chaperone FlgN n=1 Tax=Janthinobacterium fluminis TaxID=2987524 RepID=A0ABT5JUQ5_9BURK|nr:flagellar export chaperone FlgN [Janthinobacterium fluminis]MDC8756487.1 flagellar export chaperone FlgN [Janthinobacterium fluminis]
MSKLTRQQALARLGAGVAEDVSAYQALLLLLEEQFDAALHHRSARLAALGEDVVAVVEAMELRRRQRVALVRALLGAEATMAQAIALCEGEARAGIDAGWRELALLATECKRRNQRNNDLLTDQYTIMQRVLQGEDQIYAPR